MAKFPSQRKLNYESGNTADGVGTLVGNVNLPKDLSLLNRRGYASTTRKGVPLVYKAKIDHYMVDEDGITVAAAVGHDLVSTLTIDGCQNNWVMKNAAVKFHAAREELLKQAGVTKGSRGAYAHEIRYNFDGASDAFMSPLDAGGNEFTGGTWDVTSLGYTGDTAFQLSITGTGDDEEADAFSGAVISIGHSYLMSRSNVLADTNPERDEAPAKFSVLNSILDDPFRRTGEVDDIRDNADGEQDNPPYEVLDISASGDTAHDITKEVELGRCVAGIGTPVSSVIVEIPFGLCQVNTRFEDAAATDTTLRSMFSVEILDIFEMQG